MIGQVCIVTGANSGIGKATALGLAKMGANVIMVCRSRKRGVAARDEVIRESSNPSVDLMLADLSSQNCIQQFVSKFKQKYSKLHVLINNAGVNLSKRSITTDGIETTFAVNYIAQFILSNLLLDMLLKSIPSRIVNVASIVQSKEIHFDDLNFEKGYHQLKVYSQSKFAVAVFSHYFAKKLEGTGVTVNCVHPGVVKTNMIKNFKPFVKHVYGLVGLFMMKPKRGAKASLYLATSPEVEGHTGMFFKRKKEMKSSRSYKDEELAERLWKVSKDLTNINSNTMNLVHSTLRKK